jgi:hypothetical protein
MYMKLPIFIFLCFLLLDIHILYGQVSLIALADSTANKQEYKHGNAKEEVLLLKQANSKKKLHFQLDTDSIGRTVVLIHLKDTADILIISAHDFMGRSQEVIREPKLKQGFYEFALSKVPQESLKYWQISMDGQRVISFIR